MNIFRKISERSYRPTGWTISLLTLPLALICSITSLLHVLFVIRELICKGDEIAVLCKYTEYDYRPNISVFGSLVYFVFHFTILRKLNLRKHLLAILLILTCFLGSFFLYSYYNIFLANTNDSKKHEAMIEAIISKNSEAISENDLDLNSTDYSNYIKLLQNKIKSHWTWPERTEVLQAKIYIEIETDGRISKLELEETSGNQSFDNSMISTINNANPFPKPPANFYESVKRMHLVFDSRDNGRSK